MQTTVNAGIHLRPVRPGQSGLFHRVGALSPEMPGISRGQHAGVIVGWAQMQNMSCKLKQTLSLGNKCSWSAVISLFRSAVHAPSEGKSSYNISNFFLDTSILLFQKQSLTSSGNYFGHFWIQKKLVEAKEKKGSQKKHGTWKALAHPSFPCFLQTPPPGNHSETSQPHTPGGRGFGQ